METGLRGRSALITGGASGIGKAITLALAAEGAQVFIADVHAGRGARLVDEIMARGGQATYTTCDVADEAMVAGAVQEAVDAAGRLDVMVNNAGIATPPAPIIEGTAEDWDRVYAVNLRGVFFGLKHAARAMLAQSAPGGSIINIASVAGLGGAPLLGPYGPMKAGVIELTQTAALELATRGVRVNAVCPGWIETAILRDAERSQLLRQVPMQRIGQPEEVAGLVVYLASDAATFITGSAFRVDGGMRS